MGSRQSAVGSVFRPIFTPGGDDNHASSARYRHGIFMSGGGVDSTTIRIPRPMDAAMDSGIGGGDACYSHLMQIYLQIIAAVWEAVKRGIHPKTFLGSFQQTACDINHRHDPWTGFRTLAKFA